MRPDWQHYFLDVAGTVATRATCPRAQVGAVLVRQRQILATGYNGSPMGQPHCLDEGCLMDDAGRHCLRAVHAEENTIAQAARFGVQVDGSTLYITHEPCYRCCRLIINAGIARVVFRQFYTTERAGLSLLREAGVAVTLLDIEPLPIEVDGSGYARLDYGPSWKTSGGWGTISHSRALTFGEVNAMALLLDAGLIYLEDSNGQRVDGARFRDMGVKIEAT